MTPHPTVPLHQQPSHTPINKKSGPRIPPEALAFFIVPHAAMVDNVRTPMQI